MFRLYNPSAERILLSCDTTWSDFKLTDPTKNINIFVEYNSTEIVPGIDELVVDVKNYTKLIDEKIHGGGSEVVKKI